MFECVAEQTYASVTVADVARRARVSCTDFYRLFEDKEACYLAASDEAGADLLALLAGLEPTRSWVDDVRRGVRAFLRWWRERPGHALAYLVELPSVSRRALEQRDRIYQGFARMYAAVAERARGEQPELEPLPPLAPLMVVTETTEIVAREVRAGRVGRLEELEDELVYCIVKGLADERTAEGARCP
jgi:AcrR family transcriptional regulator